MKSLLLFVCMFSAPLVFAQENPPTTQSSEAQAETTPNKQYETVVEGTAFNSTSKVILDQQAIKQTKAPNVLSLLASQANLAVSTSNLQPGSIFLRGGDSSHILILVDGLPFYDASTTARTANLNSIDIKSIRRIEIIKGSQSVLYGGQALTGVIKIETLPVEMEDQAGAIVEAGQYEYRKVSATGFKTLSENQGVLARGQVSDKNNRSPVLDSDRQYWSRMQAADLAHVYRGEFDSYVKVNAQTLADDIVTTVSGGKAADTNGFMALNRVTGASAGLRGKKWPIKPQLLVGYQNFQRKFEQLPATDLHYGSDLLAVRAETQLVDLEHTALSFGLSYNKEQFVERSAGVESSNALYENQAAFVKLDHALSDFLEVELGARSDFASRRDRVDTQQVGVTLMNDLRFEYATAYKAPSLFQMNSVQYGGSNDLKPEKAQTYSLTYEKEVGADDSEYRHFYSATVFETSFENLIAYVGAPPTGKYFNVGKTQTRGVEATYSVKKPKVVRFDFNFGYQEPWDVTNVRWLHRRPLHNGSIRITGEFDRTEAGFETLWTGDRLDSFQIAGVQGITTLPGYILTNVFATQRLTDQISAYVRGNNLENVRFESARGYHDEGTFWLAGAEISL